jgi:hypothetical protein
VIFSRGRGRSGKHVRADEPRRSGPRHAASDRADEYGDEPFDDEPRRGEAPPDGPYDVAEDPPDMPRLDLGSLQIPAIEGVEVRVQADPDGAVQQVVLVHGTNALQLGVFAAPRSEGIWDEVRTEIRKGLFEEGVAAEEVPGQYGVELRARVRTAEGGLTDIRFVGVDGPRWMVRGVYQGSAAVDPANAGPLADCLRGLVVDRGAEAKPVREPLALRLPKEVADQAGQAAAGAPSVEPAGAEGPRINGTAPAAPPGGGGTPRRRPSPRPRRR